MLRTRIVTIVLATVAPLMSGCAGGGPTVALLVADGSDTSSRAVDVERFTDRVEATCDECRVAVYDAEGDADTQKSQARQAEAGSADVVVVVPVQPGDLETLTASDLPVVSLEVLLGEERSMTYVPTRAMSEQAADAAVGFLADEPLAGDEEVDGVESWLHRDQEVTVDSLTSVLVGQGVVTLDELCAGETAKRCARLGLR